MIYHIYTRNPGPVPRLDVWADVDLTPYLKRGGGYTIRFFYNQLRGMLAERALEFAAFSLPDQARQEFQPHAVVATVYDPGCDGVYPLAIMPL
jgi:hypothetical protein